jgi:pimeloyl-ACP methyl ester carboxylesterase
MDTDARMVSPWIRLTGGYPRANSGNRGRMPPTLPELPGVEHTWLDLPTGVRVHVALAGPEGAPRVLALHGWPQHWWSWRRVIEALGGTVRIACPDLRGLGWSGWPDDGDFAKPRLVDDALATLDALGWERALLAGHDWGALTGYLTALRAPERLDGLLAISAAHPWQPPLRVARNAWRFAYQLPLAAPWLGPASMRDGRLARLMLQAAWGDDGRFTDAELETYLAVLREDGPARATAGLYRSFLLRDAPRLGQIVAGQRLRVPTRLLYGTREPLGAALAAGLEAHGDDASVEMLEGVGHWVPESRPELVAERIRAMAA